MARTYDEIDDTMREWIARQPMFFVASAPLAGDGHVNLSPKGPGGSLRVLGPQQVAYLDIVGSGAETIAHLRENGRIVVMLCAFSGPPRILRLHGTGEVIGEDDARFAELVAGMPSIGPPESTRAVIAVDVERIADSCGYGVPLMEAVGARPQQPLWVERKLAQGGAAAIAAYMDEHNTASIDGLPALRGA
jgi:hypothetical protein